MKLPCSRLLPSIEVDLCYLRRGESLLFILKQEQSMWASVGHPQKHQSKQHSKVVTSTGIVVFHHSIICQSVVVCIRGGQLAARGPHMVRHSFFSDLRKHSGKVIKSGISSNYHNKWQCSGKLEPRLASVSTRVAFFNPFFKEVVKFYQGAKISV